MVIVSPPVSGDDEVLAVAGGLKSNTLSTARSLLNDVAGQVEDDLAQLMQRIAELKEQRAGFRPDPTGDDARRRLQNPNLKTTYVDDRIKALSAKACTLRTELTERVRQAITPALTLDLVEAELAAFLAARAEHDRVKGTKVSTGLYPAVASSADYLFEQFRVTHWHWSNADPVALRSIAEILLRATDLTSRDERDERLAELYR